MTDLKQILSLWQELHLAGVEYVLATVVAVDGSGYRKPGARMLIAADGRRTGTISGGCLEGEVARKAFWHTEHGPVVRQYSTASDDGDVPFGMGCGGVVHLLLERSATAGALLETLASHFEARQPLAMATVLEGRWTARRALRTATGVVEQYDSEFDRDLRQLASIAFEQRRSFTRAIRFKDDRLVDVRAEWSAARPGLFVFGAGDDALPVTRLAGQLGWHAAVIDGRSNLATSGRFPNADEVHVLEAGGAFPVQLLPSDVAVVMTHSLEQDTNALRWLLRQDLRYIGVLGPRRRTLQILEGIALEMQLGEAEGNLLAEEWLGRLHAPMGLDLGGETPADIALAILAEIQQCLNHGSGLPLREVRGRLAEKTVAGSAV